MTLYRQKNIVININWWEELRVANKKWSLSEVCISSFIVNKTNKFMYTRRQQNKACHIFHLSNCYWYYFLWQLMKLFKVTKCRLTTIDERRLFWWFSVWLFCFDCCCITILAWHNDLYPYIHFHYICQKQNLY